VELEVGGHAVRISNPDRVYFPARGETKVDLARYYLSVGDGIVRALRERPCMLHRFPDGTAGERIYQKRLPKHAPEWMDTVHITFPSGRTAQMPVMADAAHLVWGVNLGVIDFNPWPARRADLDHPDELRVDLDPQPGVPFDGVREVAGLVHDVLVELGYEGYPKTSGSRGIHINVRIEPRWTFPEVRRAALALARDVEGRAPTMCPKRKKNATYDDIIIASPWAKWPNLSTP